MNIGVIFAGGTGTRMRTKDKPKQFLEVFSKPIIIYTLEHFEKNDEIDAVVVACLEDWIPYLWELCQRFGIKKVKDIVPGGASGQLSIYNGLCAAMKLSQSEDDIVLIHDGVRPMINTKVLSDDIASVKKCGSAITTGVVKETITVIDEQGRVQEITNRDQTRVAKAPQCFYLHEIYKNHLKAMEEGRTNFIDSCCLMKHYGYELATVDGPYENIKVTTPDDYYMMKSVIEARENAQFIVGD